MYCICIYTVYSIHIYIYISPLFNFTCTRWTGCILWCYLRWFCGQRLCGCGPGCFPRSFRRTRTHLQRREQNSRTAPRPSCSRASSQCGAWCTPTTHLGSSPAAESTWHKWQTSCEYHSLLDPGYGVPGKLSHSCISNCQNLQKAYWCCRLAARWGFKTVWTLLTTSLFHIETSTDSWFFFFLDILSCWWNPQIPGHCSHKHSVVVPHTLLWKPLVHRHQCSIFMITSHDARFSHHEQKNKKNSDEKTIKLVLGQNEWVNNINGWQTGKDIRELSKEDGLMNPSGSPWKSWRKADKNMMSVRTVPAVTCCDPNPHMVPFTEPCGAH